MAYPHTQARRVFCPHETETHAMHVFITSRRHAIDRPTFTHPFFLPAGRALSPCATCSNPLPRRTVPDAFPMHKPRATTMQTKLLAPVHLARQRLSRNPVRCLSRHLCKLSVSLHFTSYSSSSHTPSNPIHCYHTPAIFTMPDLTAHTPRMSLIKITRCFLAPGHSPTPTGSLKARPHACLLSRSHVNTSLRLGYKGFRT